MSSSANSVAAAETSVSGTRNWRYVVGLLTVVYALNFLDRQIVNILAEPIKTDLGLKDWQLGVLTGLAFALVYSVTAIPVARLAERTHRPRLIAAALTVWSGFTIVCSFTQNFGQLALARFAVGLGESGCAPAAHALIIESTPKHRRSLAMGIFNTGFPIGTLVAMGFGGVIADQWGWRVAFLLAGAPGLLCALLILATLGDPRQLLPKAEVAKSSFFEDARFLLTKKSFPLFAFGGGLIALRSYGTQAFIASFFFRLHDQELQGAAAQVNQAFGTSLGPTAILGPALGVLGGLAGILGTVAGGLLMDRLAARDIRHYALAPAIPQIIAAPFLVAGLFWPTLWGGLILMTIPTVLSAMSSAPVWAGIQGMANSTTRATASAMGLLVTVLVGLGLGPVLIGVTSDLIALAGFSSGEGLRLALLVGETPALIGAVLFLMARRHLRKDMEAI